MTHRVDKHRVERYSIYAEQVLRTRTTVRTLTREDRDAALDLCARDIGANVFVAARILEGALDARSGPILGHRGDDGLDSLCWASANLVPVETTEESRQAFAERIRRWRGRCASLFGPREQVTGLWREVADDWGPPRAVRSSQPLMGSSTPPSVLGVEIDRRVRPASPDEVDLVLPAAAHMFTSEIGYAPFTGSPRAYRSSLQSLIGRGHTYVVVDSGRVVFKADLGSVALGCAQVQGVWLSPELRGQGLAVPMMASVLEQVMHDHATFVTLYVNDFNHAARATYTHIGMTDLGQFTTILL